MEPEYRRVPSNGLNTGAWFLAGLLGAGIVLGLISFACAQVCP